MTKEQYDGMQAAVPRQVFEDYRAEFTADEWRTRKDAHSRQYASEHNGHRNADGRWVFEAQVKT